MSEWVREELGRASTEHRHKSKRTAAKYAFTQPLSRRPIAYSANAKLLSDASNSSWSQYSNSATLRPLSRCVSRSLVTQGRYLDSFSGGDSLATNGSPAMRRDASSTDSAPSFPATAQRAPTATTTSAVRAIRRRERRGAGVGASSEAAGCGASNIAGDALRCTAPMCSSTCMTLLLASACARAAGSSLSVDARLALVESTPASSPELRRYAKKCATHRCERSTLMLLPSKSYSAIVASTARRTSSF